MRFWESLLVVFLLTMAPVRAAEPFDPVAAGELPRYIFFNKAPDHAGPMAWRQDNPNSFTAASCEEIAKAAGSRGTARLRPGVSFVFSIMETKADVLAKSIRHLLASAQQADVPVLIALDGENWWRNRPDLWNWWDRNRPGFDESNRFNVEWTGWGPEHAIKIAWRNWAQQRRIPPAPNIASPKFLAEHWKAYRVLVPVIVDWYRQLPADRKYLLGGLKVGWEASIGVNAYHYPDGNRIFEDSPADASKDPDRLDPQAGWTLGAATLGYAAATTSGIKKSGVLTKEDIERLVHEYLARLVKEARRYGILEHLLFTHQGGTYAPWAKHLSFKPAIVDESIPGWSFYGHDPPDCGSLADDLAGAGRRQWVAAEWWCGGANRADWQNRFERTLGFKQCRLICVYNWESFQKLPDALAAVRTVLETPSTRPAATSPPS